MLEPRKPRDYKDQYVSYVVGLLIPCYGFIYFHTKIINTIALHKLVVSNMHIQVVRCLVVANITLDFDLFITNLFSSYHS